MAIDAKFAREIINEYNSGGYEEHIPLPETDEETIKKAEFLYEKAKEAFEAGVKDNAVQAIMFFGSGQDAKIAESYPRKSSGGFSDSDIREGEATLPPVLAHSISDLISASAPIGEARELLFKERLPVPPHIDGDAAYLGRVTYLLGIELADLANATHLLDDAKNTALRNLKVEKKLAKVIEAEIAADTQVKEWSDKVVEHEKKVIVLKAMKEIYSSNVDRLSREWTMRQNEWEKSK